MPNPWGNRKASSLSASHLWCGSALSKHIARPPACLAMRDLASPERWRDLASPERWRDLAVDGLECEL
jgi:hypothetical protein